MITKTTGPGYEIVPFSRLRELVIDVMIPAQKKHNIHMVFEADVTDIRERLRALKAETGRSLSFTAFLAKCTADASMTNKRLMARRISARKLVLFDDAHVNCMVETEVDGQSQPLNLIIRQANRKGLREINEEVADFTEENKREQLDLARKASKIPRAIRARALSYMFNNPDRVVREGFNVIVTFVGMFGAGGGHIIPYTDASLCIGVGGITKKPGVVGNRIEPREYLSITTTHDHDITDGAPAARFAQALRERIEDGISLLE